MRCKYSEMIVFFFFYKLYGREENLWLNVTGKVTITSLFIPLFNPVNRTQSRISLEEDLAWSKVLTFGVDTFVVVNVGLVTVLGLVLVWETGVKTNGVQWRVRHCEMISYVELCCVCMLRIGELVAILLTCLV